MAYSIAIWDWTPDTWSLLSGETSTTLYLITTPTTTLYFDNGWQSTSLPLTDALSSHGMKSLDADWNALYSQHTGPFTLIAWEESEEVEEKTLTVEWEEAEYTVARVYEGEIEESELQKIKGLEVV